MDLSRFWHLLWRGGAALAAAALGVAGPGTLTQTGAPQAGAAQALPAWTVYHGNASGSGVAQTSSSFSASPTLSTAWHSTVLDGQVYGEPLEADGRVFAATENDTVYAVAANTGEVLWKTHVATPVPSTKLPCGDITPQVGITGTPVIDAARHEIFVVADQMVGAAVSHVLYGLNLFTGVVELTRTVDPPGSTAKALLQRTGLNLSDGHVVFGYGGNYGDCSSYHGWIISVPESGGGTIERYEVDPASGDDQGAVWLGGAAPEVNATGDVWAAAGNGSVTSTKGAYDYSDSVFELSPALGAPPLQYFSPSDWYSDNGSDRDLGSTAPALLPDGTVLQVGKSETGYLLTAGHLGGIGGQLTQGSVCSANADGGDAVSGSVVYVACGNGLQRVTTEKTPPSLDVTWTAATGEHGPPIIAGGLVWSIGGGTLYGIDPSSGHTEVSGSIGSEANHFPTPSVGDGLLLAPGGSDGDQIDAFVGSAGLPPGPTPTPATAPYGTGYDLVGQDGGVFVFDAPGQTGGFYGSLPGLGVKPNAPIVGMVPTVSDRGYFLVGADGGVYAFGTAPFLGSLPGLHVSPNQPISGIVAVDTDQGYFLVGRDGGVYAFGKVAFSGSLPSKGIATTAVVGIAATPSGNGYWVVLRTGTVYSFGTAMQLGGVTDPTSPVSAIAGTPTGAGYWITTQSGGVYAFGVARKAGTQTLAHIGVHPALPIVGIVHTTGTDGYWLLGADGGIFAFGTASYYGSLPGLGVHVTDITGAVPN